MRFLLDQSSDARLVAHLTSKGHDAIRIGRDYPPGLPDVEVLALAVAEHRILITDDRDFGKLVIHRGLTHTGVIYFRLENDADLTTKIARLDHVLATHAADLAEGRYLVVSEQRIRVRSDVRKPE